MVLIAINVTGRHSNIYYNYIVSIFSKGRKKKKIFIERKIKISSVATKVKNKTKEKGNTIIFNEMWQQAEPIKKQLISSTN